MNRTKEVYKEKIHFHLSISDSCLSGKHDLVEFTEKYTKKYVKGSTVVEMSYLIPFCLILFFLLITIIFYFHDKAILNAAAAETAVTGVEMDRKKIEDADLDAFFRERTSGKLIFLENITTRVDLSGKKIEVEVLHQKDE